MVEDDKPLVRLANQAADKMVDRAIEDPMTTLANLDAIADLGMKLLPTLPTESVIPLPRGLYEKLLLQLGGKK